MKITGARRKIGMLCQLVVRVAVVFFENSVETEFIQSDE
jgi:hypothetical protein